MEFNIEVTEHLIIKLPTIISDNGIGKPESIDDWFPKNALNYTLGDMCKEFYLDPTSNVVDGNYEEFSLTVARENRLSMSIHHWVNG